MSSSAPTSELSKGISTPFTQLSSIRPRAGPSRAVTEVSPPVAPKVHKHHHHHPHLHRSSKEPKEPQSAGANLQPSVSHTADLLGASSNDGSRDVSRRGSMFVDELRKDVKDGQLEAEKEKSDLRAGEIRKSVLELNELSNTTTRRLDNTYYSVLEKLSTLQNTVTSMSELAAEARAVKDNFEAEGKEFTSDISARLAAFDNFTTQAERIKGLQARVTKGRENIVTLNKRVASVRKKAESWQAAEKEWEDRLKKRLKAVVWVVVLVVSVVIAVVVFQNKRTSPAVEPPTGLNATGLLGKIPDMEPLKNESTGELSRKIEKAYQGEMKAQEGPEDDPILRIFDEL